jgi:hypothetical protein
MPITWGRHDNKRIFLDVVILGEADAALVHRGQPPSRLQLFKALIDTWASGTCITRQTATKMGLAPIGKIPIQGVFGANYHNSYLFYFGLMVQSAPIAGANVSSQQFGQQLHMLPTPIEGAEFEAGNHGFDVLLGMDVITSGSLAVGGNGTFSWAW